MKRKNVYPIELEKHPNWPVEMVCDGCGFRGWHWLGCTKLLFNLYSQHNEVSNCGKCGVGVMTTQGGGKLALFILK